MQGCRFQSEEEGEERRKEEGKYQKAEEGVDEHGEKETADEDEGFV